MGKKKWILTVDDDPAVLMILEEALSHPDLIITSANDALQAFIQAKDLSPILIISDIQMPGFGYGPETLKMLRADPRIPRVPIIFMTGMDLEKARQLLPSNDPTVGLMPKPLDLEKLRDYAWRLAGIIGPGEPAVATNGVQAAAHNGAPAGASATVRPGARKILIVETDLAMGGLMRSSLRDGGFDPVVCAPDEALSMAVEHSAAALLISLASSCAEPPPFYGALRADPRTRNLPMILITGREDLTIRLRRGEKPAQLLFKPLELPTLAQTVTRAIEGA